MSSLPRVMLVTDRHGTSGRDLVEVLARAAAGGAGLIQVREKDLDDAQLTELVHRVLAAVPPETRVVLNGRLDVALETGCGLHLPAAASPPDERSGLPILGRSAHNLEEGRRAVEDRADYLILGPIYATPSKPGHPGSGTGLLQTIATRLSPLPVFAIGGIEPARCAELRRCGAYGVAVRRAILSANDPFRAAHELASAAEG